MTSMHQTFMVCLQGPGDTTSLTLKAHCVSGIDYVSSINYAFSSSQPPHGTGTIIASNLQLRSCTRLQRAELNLNLAGSLEPEPGVISVQTCNFAWVSLSVTTRGGKLTQTLGYTALQGVALHGGEGKSTRQWTEGPGDGDTLALR